MPGRIPEHVIQQIARSTDIVRLIGRYTKLTKRGRRLVGLCPFHKEKTPSFTVDPEQGLYHCFGCKEGGNLFTFLKKTEGLEFHEALHLLAREAGVDLSQYETGTGPSRRELDSLRAANELAATFYEKCLQKAAGSERARSYLKTRQISDESVRQWRIGYAPEGWDHFMELAARRGLSPSALEAAGLAVPRTGMDGHYDRFRNRLMFPVRDRNAHVIGFGARALSDEDDPKYLNSPEGPIFSKGHCFYGFCEARETIRTDKRAVIVEGYTDVMMAHQFGVSGVMAVLGTALTEHHARTLASLCESVVLVFDADEAGQKSATRSIEVLLGEDMEARAARLEPGEDPCDFILARGADAFRERIDKSEDFLAFRLRRAAETNDLSTLAGRTRAFEELAELATAVRNEAKRDMLVRTIGRELGISEQSAFAYLERTWSRARGPAPAAAAEDAGLKAVRTTPGELLGVLLVNADLQRRACKKLDLEAMQECAERELIERLLARCRDEGSVEAGEFIHSLDEQELISCAANAAAEAQKRREAAESRGEVQLYEEQVYEGYSEYLRQQKMKLKKQSFMLTTIAPAMTTATKAPSEGSEDEQLRKYYDMRRQEDATAAKINPKKQAR